MVPTLPRTLLVDDDPTTNFLNRKLLEKMGFADQVMVALNGRDALQILDKHCQDNSETCPSLLFLDVNMPLMDGFEFLTAYQKLSLAERNAIVIVMLTTSVHPRDLQRLEQLPVAGFLSKPLTEDKVKQVLAENFN
ncbi:response regulator [Hymenobacter wooponensis]|uniref:Response regulator n=1 Tax=Hymenobacter wooponensis TaxID=1525360 RepID=A0A4Z0MSX1_9BACT|nr:response regulator [Hymenobacter wooponensis]TGD82913.1 response regulator [Hymenobacter wooponensis]